jgi:uncharacterized membrane protein YphA (DoxX/SURF4 family)
LTDTPKIDRNARVLALLRIGVGMLFLIFAEYKVFGSGFTLGGGFQGYVSRYVARGAYPFMVPLLRVFVAHPLPMAFLVTYGELAIGLALVLGIAVRAASVAGLLFMIALLFSADYPGAGAAFWQYFGASLTHLPLAMCFAAFVWGDADRVFSLRSAVGRGGAQASAAHHD